MENLAQKETPNLLNQLPGSYNSPKGLSAAGVFNRALPESLGYGKQEMNVRKMLEIARSPHTWLRPCLSFEPTVLASGVSGC